MKNNYSIEIEAPPERVFYWLDDAERVMKWVPNIVENEDLVVTEEKIGSTFRQVYLENGRRMEMHGEVTGYEANRRLTTEISGDVFDLLVDYHLEDLGGRTRLTQDSEVRFKGFFKIIGPIMTPFVRKASLKQLEESFATLKTLSERSDEERAGY